MSKTSVRLNVLKKPTTASRPPPAKRKPIFNNDDSDAEEDKPASDPTTTIESITTLDDDSARPSSKPTPSSSSIASSTPKLNEPPIPPKRALNKPPQTENISSKYTSTKHAQQAEELDPSIYDYDGIYDAMKAAPPSSSTNTGDGGGGSKPKYMSALKAAAEVRKRDYIRAQDKKTAREREAEGEEFKDKESFVTGAYKRQQEELRRLEEEEKVKEAEEEEKKRKEGAGMKQFYKNLLERDEERHQAAMKAVEENKGKVLSATEQGEGDKSKKEKSEAEIAREKGVAVNEEGEVVDKRDLLKAGLNAGNAAKVKKPIIKPGGGTRKGETQRERETREFEEQLLGKHGYSSDEDDDGGGGGEDARARKSRKMEDELLKGLQSP